MKEETNWEKLATSYLKAELARKSMSYRQLSDALKKIGVYKTENAINGLINRGAFSFAFILQCAKAIGIEKIIID